MNEISPRLKIVGADLPRKDAVPKTTGTAMYTVDVAFPGMLHAKVLRSPHAHARIVSIDASAARDMPGVHAVVTRDDLEGLNPTYGYFIKDQPVVAIDKVRPLAAIMGNIHITATASDNQRQRAAAAAAAAATAAVGGPAAGVPRGFRSAPCVVPST